MRKEGYVINEGRGKEEEERKFKCKQKGKKSNRGITQAVTRIHARKGIKPVSVFINIHTSVG